MTPSIRAEVLTIGDEILFGHITDTNTQWLGVALTTIGIRVVRKTSIGDEADAILDALHNAHQRADVIILTGGLGPTKDDITKKTLCTYFGVGMIRNEAALALVSDFFARRNRPLTDLNRAQADLPANATYIQNDWGTAPGMWFEWEGRVYVSLPGVPFEMKNLMTERILPRLKAHFRPPVILHRNIRTIGIGESFLAERIADWEDALPPHIRLAYLPQFGQVKLRLTGTGTDENLLAHELEAQVQAVLPLIQTYVYGFDDDDIDRAIKKTLLDKKLTVSAAESCTGGFVSAQLTREAGASAFFKGSIIAYANEIKTKLLGVKPETLTTDGAVSEATIRQMAAGVRAALQTDIGLATSGIAGPDGGTPDKPVGTVWIAVATPAGTVARKLTLSPFREQNIQLATTHLFNLLREQLAAL